MASGVSVREQCSLQFNDMKIKKHCRYIIFALTPDLKEIEVKSIGQRDSSYEDFLAELQEAESLKECRYGVFDVDYKGAEDQDRAKIVFMLWSPEGATVKQKMLYTSSKHYIKRALVGIGKEVQATDMAEASLTSVLEKLKSH